MDSEDPRNAFWPGGNKKKARNTNNQASSTYLESFGTMRIADHIAPRKRATSPSKSTKGIKIEATTAIRCSSVLLIRSFMKKSLLY